MAVIATRLGVAHVTANILSNFGGRAAQLTTDPALASQTTDRSAWELTAGDSIQLHLLTQRINGDGDNTTQTIARIYYETGTGTLVRELYNSTPTDLAAGSAWQLLQSFTFYATHDGTASGTPCGGTLRLYVQIIRGSGGGTNDFNVNSDGAVTNGINVTSTASYVGVLRSNSKALPPTVSAYTAGLLHANGEAFTLSGNATRPFATRGHEKVRLDCLSGTATHLAGSASQLPLTGLASQQFTVAGPGFPAALASYGAACVPVGDAALVPTSGAISWTHFVAQVGAEQVGSGVRKQSFYSADASIKVDLHPQITRTLVKDPIDNPDRDEVHSGVILGNTFFIWVHVTNARDEDVSTSGGAVVFEIRRPDGAVVTTFTDDTGADGWTAMHEHEPGSPPGDWVYSATVTRNGIAKTDAETITQISPLTSNLEIMLRGPVLAKPGQTVRVWARCEKDDLPVEPQDQPVWRLFDEELNEFTSETSWLSAATGTAVINGARYYADITLPSAPGRYVLWARAQLNGNGIRRSRDLRIAEDELDWSGLPSAGPG